MKHLIKTVIAIVLLLCYTYTVNILTLAATEQPQSDWLEISDNINTYYIHNSATVSPPRELFDNYILRYEIDIEDVRGSFTIVYKDQFIEGQFVSAKMWLDSFIMAMEEFKNVSNWRD